MIGADASDVHWCIPTVDGGRLFKNAQLYGSLCLSNITTWTALTFQHMPWLQLILEPIEYIFVHLTMGSGKSFSCLYRMYWPQ